MDEPAERAVLRAFLEKDPLFQDPDLEADATGEIKRSLTLDFVQKAWDLSKKDGGTLSRGIQQVLYWNDIQISLEEIEGIFNTMPSDQEVDDEMLALAIIAFLLENGRLKEDEIEDTDFRTLKPDQDVVVMIDDFYEKVRNQLL